MLNFRLDLCFAHRTPQVPLDSTNLRTKRRDGIANSRDHRQGALRSIGRKGLARQGIEPWSTDYETAALPLSYRAAESN